MGRQINASVLYIINEVELLIYRFLTSRAKKNKKQSQSVELGIDRFTNIKLLQLDLTGKEDTSTKKRNENF